MKFLTHDGLLYFWQKVKSMIGNISNLSTGTNLVDAVNQCFQNVSNGKELIASTLTDKGIDTSSDATFDVINTNINQLSNTSDATAYNSDVISGKTFYSHKLKKTGTLVNYGSATTQTHYTTVNGNNLLMYIPKRGVYSYNAILSSPYSNVANALGITSDKIVSGNTICNVVGTGGGKRYTSGTDWSYGTSGGFTNFCWSNNNSSTYGGSHCYIGGTINTGVTWGRMARIKIVSHDNITLWINIYKNDTYVHMFSGSGSCYCLISDGGVLVNLFDGGTIHLPLIVNLHYSQNSLASPPKSVEWEVWE